MDFDLDLDLGIADRGDSSIVGSVLVIAIVVVLAIVLGAFVFSITIPDTTAPGVSITDTAEGDVRISVNTMGTADQIEVNYDTCDIHYADGTRETDVSPCVITDSSETAVITDEHIASGPDTIRIFGQYENGSRELVQAHTPAGNSLSTEEDSNFIVPESSTGSNSPVPEGGTLKVDAIIRNDGEQPDIQDVTVTVEDPDDGSIIGSDTKRVSLDSGTSKEYSEENGNPFTIETGSGDSGEHNAIVETEQDSLTFPVEITPGSGDPDRTWCENEFLTDAAGTTSDRHTITTTQELQCMAAAPDEHYQLGSNVDASNTATTDWRGGNGFDPVGHPNNYLSDGSAFTGSLDGQGYEITGLTINRGSTDTVGLIGQANSATVANVSLLNVDITGDEEVGGLVGAQAGGTLGTASEPVTVTGTVDGSTYIGGLVGSHTGTGASITQATVTATVNGEAKTGGIAGGVHDGATIDNATSDGSVDGVRYIGGLVGHGRSSNSGVTNSTAHANVTGDRYVGGFVGYAHNNFDLAGDSLNANNAATGDVTATGYAVGGFAGALTDVHVYDGNAEGRVEGRSHVGGLVGSIEGATHIQNSAASGGDVVNVDPYEGSESDTYGDYITGGLVGNVSGPDALVEGSTASNDVVSNYNRTGGLIGRLGGSGQVLDSQASGSVTGADYTGGLVGYVSAQNDGVYTIKNSSANGSSVDGNLKSGGLVGVTSVGSDALITGSSASVGSVDGMEDAGGLIGRLQGSSEVENSYVSGTVVNGGANTGGLIGHVVGAPVRNSYVTNVTVTGDDGSAGLVGTVDGGTISNTASGHKLRVSNSSITGNLNVGGLTGKTISSATIQDARVEGTDVTGAGLVGGLVGGNGGTNPTSFTIADSVVTSTVSVQSNHTDANAIGGLVGSHPGGSITNSEAHATVEGDNNGVGGLVGSAGINSDTIMVLTISGSNAGSTSGDSTVTGHGKYTGGLVGLASAADISNSQAHIDVTGDDLHVGGLVGQMASPAENQITGSHATGNVVGEQGYVGGLVGSIRTKHTDSTKTIYNSYAEGNVNVDATSDPSTHTKVGGLIGSVVTSAETQIQDTQAYGDVTGGSYVGGLVGNLSGASTVENSSAENNSVTGTTDADGNGNTGGLVGTVVGARVVNSYADNTVTGETEIGGLVGLTTGSAYIDNSHSNSTVRTASGVSGAVDTGGLVGEHRGGTINASYATGTVDGSNRTGGLVGYSQGNEITNSYAKGAVTGDDYVGGITGFANNVDINDTYATGDVTGAYAVGGLIGQSSGTTLTRTHATGHVTGNDRTGGLIGYLTSATLSESYAEGTVTGGIDTGGLVGMTDLGVTISDTYATGNVNGEETMTGDTSNHWGTGGLIGRLWDENDHVSNSYAAGSVSGQHDAHTGGFMGAKWSTATDISDTYWNTSANTGSNEANSGIAYDDTDSGTTGLTESEMTGDSAASNMSFVETSGTTWETTSSFPILAWQSG